MKDVIEFVLLFAIFVMGMIMLAKGFLFVLCWFGLNFACK